jgi:hypothetical protein
MDVRKTWLKHLATSNSVQRWALACDPETFAGTARVQTRNTTYLFRNGSCFGVTTGDPERGAISDFVGMKLVGWLLGDADQLYLARKWQAGVCAVLWGAPGSTRPVALTSPTVRFARYVSADARPRPAPIREPDPTYTRINLPMQPQPTFLDSAVRAIARAI